MFHYNTFHSDWNSVCRLFHRRLFQSSLPSRLHYPQLSLHELHSATTVFSFPATLTPTCSVITASSEITVILAFFHMALMPCPAWWISTCSVIANTIHTFAIYFLTRRFSPAFKANNCSIYYPSVYADVTFPTLITYTCSIPADTMSIIIHHHNVSYYNPLQ
jgi:hypothetical protein